MKEKGLPESKLLCLVKSAQKGNEQAIETIVSELSGMVRQCARSFFLMGADRDDVIQEGMIGLFMAVINFDENKGTGFRTFASLCVTRRIAAAAKTAARKKHSPLNFYVSFDHEHGDQCRDGLEKLVIPGNSADPESLMIQREDDEFILLDLSEHLTAFERNVFECYLEGMSYREISDKLQKTQKSVNNAVFRVKNKLKNYYANNRK